jgi:methionine-rich copper-binding protein CopC
MTRILLLTAAVCLISAAAFAHAMLDRASPPVGSEVSGSLDAISLTYSEPVEPLFSTVEVTDSQGRRMDTGKPVAEADGQVLQVKLKPLPPGVYTVVWHVTSVDTHKTEGHFTFTVKP